MAQSSRRHFVQSSLALAGIGLLSGCGLVPAAQRQRTALPRIGWLQPSTVANPITAQSLAALRQGLNEHGYVEGENIVLEQRYADGQVDRLPELAAELVRLNVDVIVTTATGIRAAKEATVTLPIVMANVPDPVGQGLIASLARPGGNITGLASTTAQFGRKQLELLKETVPGASRVAVLLNLDNVPSALGLGDMQVGAQWLRLETQPFGVRAAADFAPAFAAVRVWQADALMVINDPLITLHLAEILDFAAQNRLPAMYTFKEYVVAGGLMSYGASISDLWRRAATHIDKILKGTKPGDLPVEQPTTFDIVLNLKTARALGLTIPESVLLQATEVIE
ncbi:MAG: ABC transporter substrate-binding protein [Rubrobacter sp.]|nr:ABC transporter substrate-binding protein [Rubrobacter sp.]